MSVIAATMKRSKSTRSRELNRNTREEYKVYLPDTAEVSYETIYQMVYANYQEVAMWKLCW